MQSRFAILLAVGLAAFTLSGCATSTHQESGLWQKIREAGKRCYEMKQSGEISTYYAHAQCLNAGEQKVYTEFKYPHMDLVAVYHADRLAIAQRLDDGKITLEAAEAEFIRLSDSSKVQIGRASCRERV